MNDMNKIRVVGWGGVGQSYVMKQLGSSLFNCIHDSDGEKHRPITHKDRNPIINFSIPTLYLYCDPILAVKSHYERKWADLQAYKTSGKRQILPETLNEYEEKVCDTNTDYFGFLSHARGWSRKPNVIFRTIEELSAESFMLFFDVKLKKRQSARSAVRQKYLNFYNEIYEEIKQLWGK
tara:strand:+ start:6065 stop:6601 length:537 start_codon:yes stop_codon:yes gene_type:complete